MELVTDDRFRVHGYVDVAGLEDGRVYRVESVESHGSKTIYVVLDVESGDMYRINTAELDPYIGSETYIEPIKSIIGGLVPVIGYIEVI